MTSPAAPDAPIEGSGSKPLIPVAGPWITERELAIVAEAAQSGWYENANVYCDRFEQAFARYVGTTHALSLPSCTAGLHLALAALGIGPGDEVVVPDITWIATAAPVSYVGARPVFADVDARTWCVTASTVERCLSPRTKAVIVVDLYGSTPADIDDLRALCAARNLPLIEDAAQAIGSENAGRRAGSLGDIGVFSFHGSKTMTTGEGGMLVTSREDIWLRARKLSNHGRAEGPRQFWNDEVAFKYRMSALQAALGLAQLERIDELVTRKRDIFAWYRQDLASFGDAIVLNHEPANTKNSYWMTTALVDDARDCPKESILTGLRARGVDARPFFYPLSQLPAYADTREAAVARRQNVVAAAISRNGVNLPTALKLTRTDVATAAAAFGAVVDEAGAATNRVARQFA